MNPPLRIFLLSLSALLGLVLALPALADPPGRAGRISWLAGDVLVRGGDGGDTQAATLNWPVTGGDEIITDPGARAEVRLGSTSLRLDEDTEVRITRLDDERFDVELLQGSVGVRIGSREGAEEFSLITPDGRMLAEGPGRYRADSDGRSSYFTAYRGSLRFDSQDATERVPEGRRLEAWYSGGTRFQWSAPQQDEFASWNLARDERDERLGPPAYVSPAMTGYEDLAAYGDWQEAPEYGPVWYPRGIPHDWAPYRHGRWVWVAPWGWTWVDDAPWGFAPFHYGRWVWLTGRWAWVPGRYEPRPVYAPALVAWVGSPGWSVSIGSAAVPAVGWFPLGPREVFVPFYRASPAHVRRVNITHVREVTVIERVAAAPQRARYMHRERPGAVTVVPREALAAGRPVARVALRDSARLARKAEVRPALPAAIAPPPRALQEHRRPGPRDEAARRRERTELERRDAPRNDAREAHPAVDRMERRAEPSPPRDEPAAGAEALRPGPALRKRLEAGRREQAVRRQQQEAREREMERQRNEAGMQRRQQAETRRRAAAERRQQAREQQERAAALQQRRAADEALRQQQAPRQQEMERRRREADAQRRGAEERRY